MTEIYRRLVLCVVLVAILRCTHPPHAPLSSPLLPFPHLGFSLSCWWGRQARVRGLRWEARWESTEAGWS